MYKNTIEYKEGAKLSPEIVVKYGEPLHNLLKDIHERKSEATNGFTTWTWLYDNPKYILILGAKNSWGETSENGINLKALLNSLHEKDLSYLIEVLNYNESKGIAYTHSFMQQLIRTVVINYSVKHQHNISRLSITIEDLSITAGDENEMIIRLSIAEEGIHGLYSTMALLESKMKGLGYNI